MKKVVLNKYINIYIILNRNRGLCRMDKTKILVVDDALL